MFWERRWCRWTAYDGGRWSALVQEYSVYPRFYSKEHGGDEQPWSVEGQKVVMNREARST